MSLMQMVADAYEDAQSSRERNQEQQMVEGIDDSGLCGPNEAQEAVEAWLVYARFLPPSPKKQVEPCHQSPTKAEALQNNELSGVITFISFIVSFKNVGFFAPYEVFNVECLFSNLNNVTYRALDTGVCESQSTKGAFYSRYLYSST
ncbi:hypothetical protein B0H34DRAFT_676743 [Crassisporium funariophilum]|nr:hypothetical protein B0H34DRAFT_676743 [Crassisporium funariophilum]